MNLSTKKLIQEIAKELQDSALEMIYKKQLGERVRIPKMLEIMHLETTENSVTLYFKGVPYWVRTEQERLTREARRIVEEVISRGRHFSSDK